MGEAKRTKNFGTNLARGCARISRYPTESWTRAVDLALEAGWKPSEILAIAKLGFDPAYMGVLINVRNAESGPPSSPSVGVPQRYEKSQHYESQGEGDHYRRIPR